MPSLETFANYLNSAGSQGFFVKFYGFNSDILDNQRERYIGLLRHFRQTFPEQGEADFFSAPGRTELGGNHTDHNAGRVLAAAIDLDIVAVATKNGSDMIRFHSRGYTPSVLSVEELAPVDNEKFTATALIRGVCARFRQLGFAIGGFDAVANSTVPKGSGLSSSAAYEVLVATILNELYNRGRIDRVELAKIGQYAENQYFGKPCGLMDQIASAVGGFVTLDFKDFENPLVKKVNFDFAASGYTLVIVDTWGDHASLTDEYAAVEQEMKSVARALGGRILREFSEEMVLENIPLLRSTVSDRAILRAIHFYRDDRRVVQQVAALEANDFDQFLRLINESGQSSWMLLQNCYSCRQVEQQGIPIALTASEAMLKDRGAWRVHGGGFAGTIQAFVPNDLLANYVSKMEQICGADACHAIQVRPEGAMKLPVQRQANTQTTYG